MTKQGKISYRADASLEEIRKAYDVPAPGANKIVVHLGQPGVRIAFGEKHESLESPTFHTAVTLHPMDAVSLYKILEGMLKDIETQIIAVSRERKDG